ncbi:hypothetical protein ACHAWC_008990 [Mediolabrus comicus]
MIFRPLALAAAVAGSIVGLSSAEINYSYQTGEIISTDTVSPEDPSSAAIQLASEIASPVSKDLMIFLSSEINLVTQTVAKGTNKGGKETSVASAGLEATLKYCVECPPTADEICNGGSSDVHTALPGPIVFASRVQELSVDVNLECDVTSDPPATCEVTGYVEVGLNLDTTAAHSFNFIADLSNTGTGSTNKPVQVVACFNLAADADADAVDGSAAGHVSLGSTMLIVQEASVSNFN